MKALRGARGGAALAAFAAIGLGSAHAAVLNFDFGNLHPAVGSADSVPGHVNKVLGKNEQIFRVLGVTAGLEAFFTLNATNGGSSSTAAGTYPGYGTYPGFPTQKNSGAGETGAGQSTTYPTASDTDLEIVPSTYLLIDNSDPYSLGYKSNQVTLESLQKDTFTYNKHTYNLYENAKVFAYNGPAPTSTYDKVTGKPVSTTFNPADLSLITTVNAIDGVTQKINVPLEKFLVITADPTVTGFGFDNTPVADFEAATGHLVSGCNGSILKNDWSTCNVLVHYDVFNTAPPPSVPEPSSWAMMMLGFGGLSLGRYRSARKNVAIGA